MSLLLRGGTVLIHETDDHITPTKSDILVEGSRIAKIGPSISPPSGCEIIDCTKKVISPGFIDTHHHVWQTQLKGRHANDLLLDYYPHGNFTSSLYSAEDMFWGQLGGCLEMLDVGTTTVVDFAHLNYSPEHNWNAIGATVSSGLRSVYCYTPTKLVESWQPFKLVDDTLGGHVMATLDDLGKNAPFGDGRITLGFAFDGFFMPKEMLQPLFDKVRELDIRTISVHYLRGAQHSMASLPKHIDSLGFLDERMLVAHSSNITDEDAQLYRQRGCHVSSTPSTELQMAMGVPPVCFRNDLGIQDLCALGVDCHSNNSASIPGEMRIGLQASRAMYGQEFLDKDKAPSHLEHTVEQAFNLGTINGARAIRREHELGSIAEGKFADIVIFDATSPSMICGAEHDPVAAVVLHSSPADIDMVIVDGVVRKQGGKLVDVAFDKVGEKVSGKRGAVWSEVASELTKSRARIQEEIEGIDMKAAKKAIMKAFYVDPAGIVDSV